VIRRLWWLVTDMAELIYSAEHTFPPEVVDRYRLSEDAARRLSDSLGESRVDPEMEPWK